MDPLPIVRQTVRDILHCCPAFSELDPPKRKELAQAMVKVCNTAAMLIVEEIDSANAAKEFHVAAKPKVLAVAQSAGSEFSGVSASRVAGTTQAILNAVSFPRFVTDLINGVFKAMTDSNTQQMNSYVELLNSVAASTEGFADANYGPERARQWLVDSFPGSFEMEAVDPDADPEERQERRVQLRAGASMPTEAALKTALNLGTSDSVPSGNPEQLVPLVRNNLAKTRQQMLASMVLLGMQRIVIESGRITASMRFHIDTRSAAQGDQGSTFDTRNTLTGSGSFGVGAWGASASMSSTIGYVSTQKTTTTEEMNTDLDLNSSVEINFKTDYVPLNRLAGDNQAAKIRENSRNPEAETAKAAEEARKERIKAAAASDQQRSASLDKILTPAQPSAPKPGDSGTLDAAQKARKEGGDKVELKGQTPPKTEKADDSKKKQTKKESTGKADTAKDSSTNKKETKPVSTESVKESPEKGSAESKATTANP